jgi:TonB family protein
MAGLVRTRQRIGGLLAFPVSLIFTAVGFAQTPADQAAQPGVNEPIAIEVFQAPHPKQFGGPDCANPNVLGNGSGVCGALRQGTEGWVELGFMVDPQGKPFEITVIRSTGNKIFDDAATKAIAQSTFEPGTLDGKPIESGFETKYKFVNTGMRGNVGASGAFVHEYKALASAIASGDRAAADAALGRLKIGNLYEDAYYGLATFLYAQKWGDEAQQLEGLRRAIAEEDVAHYLPKDMFQSALLERMKLEVNTRDYADVMQTWKRLQKLGVDKDTQARVLPVIDRVQKLRSDDSRYEMVGQMPEGSWHLHLFKRHFQAIVSDGFIEQVKLRCDKRYVYFNFDPKLEYQVANADGNCSVEFDGARGTKFKLVQY